MYMGRADQSAAAVRPLWMYMCMACPYYLHIIYMYLTTPATSRTGIQHTCLPGRMWLGSTPSDLANSCLSSWFSRSREVTLLCSSFTSLWRSRSPDEE